MARRKNGAIFGVEIPPAGRIENFTASSFCPPQGTIGAAGYLTIYATPSSPITYLYHCITYTNVLTCITISLYTIMLLLMVCINIYPLSSLYE